MPCWTLVIVARLVHVVRFRRGVAEPFLDDSSFLLDTNHFRPLTTYTSTSWRSSSSVSRTPVARFAVHSHRIHWPSLRSSLEHEHDAWSMKLIRVDS